MTFRGYIGGRGVYRAKMAFFVGFQPLTRHYPVMAKGAWGTPPILRVLLELNKRVNELRLKEIETKLQSATVRLKHQTQLMKNDEHGK